MAPKRKKSATPGAAKASPARKQQKRDAIVPSTASPVSTPFWKNLLPKPQHHEPSSPAKRHRKSSTVDNATSLTAEDVLSADSPIATPGRVYKRPSARAQPLRVPTPRYSKHHPQTPEEFRKDLTPRELRAFRKYRYAIASIGRDPGPASPKNSSWSADIGHADRFVIRPRRRSPTVLQRPEGFESVWKERKERRVSRGAQVSAGLFGKSGSKETNDLRKELENTQMRATRGSKNDFLEDEEVGWDSEDGYDDENDLDYVLPEEDELQQTMSDSATFSDADDLTVSSVGDCEGTNMFIVPDSDDQSSSPGDSDIFVSERGRRETVTSGYLGDAELTPRVHFEDEGPFSFPEEARSSFESKCGNAREVPFDDNSTDVEDDTELPLPVLQSERAITPRRVSFAPPPPSPHRLRSHCRARLNPAQRESDNRDEAEDDVADNLYSSDVPAENTRISPRNHVSEANAESLDRWLYQHGPQRRRGPGTPQFRAGFPDIGREAHPRILNDTNVRPPNNSARGCGDRVVRSPPFVNNANTTQLRNDLAVKIARAQAEYERAVAEGRMPPPPLTRRERGGQRSSLARRARFPMGESDDSESESDESLQARPARRAKLNAEGQEVPSDHEVEDEEGIEDEAGVEDDGDEESDEEESGDDEDESGESSAPESPRTARINQALAFEDENGEPLPWHEGNSGDENGGGEDTRPPPPPAPLEFGDDFDDVVAPDVVDRQGDPGLGDGDVLTGDDDGTRLGPRLPPTWAPIPVWHGQNYLWHFHDASTLQDHHSLPPPALGRVEDPSFAINPRAVYDVWDPYQLPYPFPWPLPQWHPQQVGVNIQERLPPGWTVHFLAGQDLRYYINPHGFYHWTAPVRMARAPEIEQSHQYTADGLLHPRNGYVGWYNPPSLPVEDYARTRGLSLYHRTEAEEYAANAAWEENVIKDDGQDDEAVADAPAQGQGHGQEAGDDDGDALYTSTPPRNRTQAAHEDDEDEVTGQGGTGGESPENSDFSYPEGEPPAQDAYDGVGQVLRPAEPYTQELMDLSSRLGLHVRSNVPVNLQHNDPAEAATSSRTSTRNFERQHLLARFPRVLEPSLQPAGYLTTLPACEDDSEDIAQDGVEIQAERDILNDRIAELEQTVTNLNDDLVQMRNALAEATLARFNLQIQHGERGEEVCELQDQPAIAQAAAGGGNANPSTPSTNRAGPPAVGIAGLPRNVQVQSYPLYARIAELEQLVTDLSGELEEVRNEMRIARQSGDALDTALGLTLGEHAAELKERDERIADLRDELALAESAAADHATLLEERDDQISELQAQLYTAQATQERSGASHSTPSNYGQTSPDWNSPNTRVRVLEAENAKLHQGLRDCREHGGQLIEKLETMTKERDEAREAFNEAEIAKKTAGAGGKVQDECRRKCRDLENEVSDLKKKVESEEGNKKNMEGKYEKAHEAAAKLERDVKKWQANSQYNKDRLVAVQAELKQAQENLSKAKEQGNTSADTTNLDCEGRCQRAEQQGRDIEDRCRSLDKQFQKLVAESDEAQEDLRRQLRASETARGNAQNLLAAIEGGADGIAALSSDLGKAKDLNQKLEEALEADRAKLKKVQTIARARTDEAADLQKRLEECERHRKKADAAAAGGSAKKRSTNSKPTPVGGEKSTTNRPQSRPAPASGTTASRGGRGGPGGLGGRGGALAGSTWARTRDGRLVRNDDDDAATTPAVPEEEDEDDDAASRGTDDEVVVQRPSRRGRFGQDHSYEPPYPFGASGITYDPRIRALESELRTAVVRRNRVVKWHNHEHEAHMSLRLQFDALMEENGRLRKGQKALIREIEGLVGIIEDGNDQQGRKRKRV